MRRLFLLFVIGVVLPATACSGRNYVLPTAPSSPAPPPVPPPSVMPAVSIAVGEVVHDTIDITDPICDPSGWDATASCKLFEVVAVSDGTLHAILKTVVPQTRDDVIDMLFSCPDLPRGYSGGGIEQRLNAPVRAGHTCSITIHFYPNVALKGSMEFELRTEM